jgi:two-component system, NarL family, sensor kinase
VRPILILFFSFLLIINSVGQNKTIDSLERRLNAVTDDREKIVILNQLGQEYQFTESEKLKTCGEEIIKLAQKSTDERSEGSGYMLLGTYHYGKSHYATALEFYFKALEIHKKFKQKNETGNALLNIGSVYESMGLPDKALENYLASLKIDEEIGNKERLSDDYTNLGVFYRHRNDLPKALQNYEKGMALDLESGDARRIAGTYINLGSIYYYMGDFSKSLAYFHKALDLAEKTNNPDALGRATNNLGELYLETKDYANALVYLSKSLLIKEKSGDREGLVNTYLNIGDAYRKQNKISEALNYFQLSQKLAKEINYKDGVKDASFQLSNTYYDQQNYKNAFNNYKEYSETKDSLFNESSEAQIAEMQTKYETEKKEQKIALLQQMEANQNLKIDSQRLQIWTLVTFSLLIVTSSVLFYNRYKQKQKQLMAKKLLEEQALRYSSVVEAQENEKVRIARDLHDGVCQILAATKMGFSNFSEDINQSIPNKSGNYKECINLLDSAASELRSVAHEIMPPALRNYGLVQALKDLAHYSFHPNINFSFEVLGNIERLTPSMEINIYRVAQELFANVIKHSEATEVSVILLRTAEQLSLLVEDNGKGISSINNSGMGLDNINLRAQMLKAKFNLSVSPNGGTLASLKLNLETFELV